MHALVLKDNASICWCTFIVHRMVLWETFLNAVYLVQATGLQLFAEGGILVATRYTSYIKKTGFPTVASCDVQYLGTLTVAGTVFNVPSIQNGCVISKVEKPSASLLFLQHQTIPHYVRVFVSDTL